MLKSLVLAICVALSNGSVHLIGRDGNVFNRIGFRNGRTNFNDGLGGTNDNRGTISTGAYWDNVDITGGFGAPVSKRYSWASGFDGQTLPARLNSIYALCPFVALEAVAGNVQGSLQKIESVIGDPSASFMERLSASCELIILGAMVQQNVNGRSGLFNGNGLTNRNGEMVVLKCGMHSCTVDCD